MAKCLLRASLLTNLLRASLLTNLLRASLLTSLLCPLALTSPAAADDLRPLVEQMFKPAFPLLLAKAGSKMVYGPPGYEEALQASIDGIVAALPPVCTAEALTTSLCGLKPLSTPSTAMAPTLAVGDTFVAVPFSANRPVQRGDIVVFPVPSGTIFLFRVIGMGGETVALRDGVVEIDGTAATLEPTGETVEGLDGAPIAIFRETLPGGSSHLVARDVSKEPFMAEAENAGPYEVPDGSVFVMGDNRHNAADSRFPDMMGSPYIEMDALNGYAAVIYVSPDSTRIGVKLDTR